jgi:hypothetical protein
MAKKKIKLNAGHYHEALDRTYCVQGIIEQMLLNHPAINQAPELLKKVQKAQDLLADVYITIGKKIK